MKTLSAQTPEGFILKLTWFWESLISKKRKKLVFGQVLKITVTSVHIHRTSSWSSWCFRSEGEVAYFQLLTGAVAWMESGKRWWGGGGRCSLCSPLCPSTAVGGTSEPWERSGGDLEPQQFHSILLYLLFAHVQINKMSRSLYQCLASWRCTSELLGKGVCFLFRGWPVSLEQDRDGDADSDTSCFTVYFLGLCLPIV